MPKKKKLFEYIDPREMTSEVLSIFNIHVKLMEPAFDCPRGKSFLVVKEDKGCKINVRLLRDHLSSIPNKSFAVIEWGDVIEILCLPVGIDPDMFSTYMNMSDRPKIKQKDVVYYDSSKEETEEEVEEEVEEDIPSGGAVYPECDCDTDCYTENSEEIEVEIDDESEDYAELAENIISRFSSYIGPIAEMQKYDPEMTNDMYNSAVLSHAFIQRRLRGLSLIKNTSDPASTLTNVIGYLVSSGKLVKISKKDAEAQFGRPVTMYKVIL